MNEKLKIENETKVVLKNGIPKLSCNNVIIPTDCYLTYIDEEGDYDNFHKANFNLYSVSIPFHNRSINENTHLQSFFNGCLEKDDSLSVIDYKINKIIKNNKNAYIFPRLYVEVSEKWENENPDELNDDGLNGGKRRACLSSDIYFEQIKKDIKKVIEYIHSQPYSENIIGYQIANAMTEEWMTFDNSGSVGKRSREKFERSVCDKKYRDSETEYHRFLNETVADRICELSAYLKELTANRLIIGSFYGYCFYHTTWEFGHSAIRKILDCKDVDFLCAPIGYWTNRAVGTPHPYMVPVASILHHGKLFFSENDTRTDLSKFVFDHPAYRTPIWLGPEREFSLELCKYHYGKALCHSHSYWWFDLWGGWYNDKDYHGLFAKFNAVSIGSLNKNLSSKKEVAVLTDEEAYYLSSIKDNSPTLCGRNPLKQIESAGVSFDMYVASDFFDLTSQYKCFIVLVPFETQKLLKIKAYLDTNKIPYLWINQENHGVTTENLRDFYKKAGVSVKFICIPQA
ncbi:MAG: hypothetical protein MJ072_01685 [Clostridia bacterium]|nr:hypothetical protein [Clostridia bacterium]